MTARVFISYRTSDGVELRVEDHELPIEELRRIYREGDVEIASAARSSANSPVST